jgi:WD40 repeat protein
MIWRAVCVMLLTIVPWVFPLAAETPPAGSAQTAGPSDQPIITVDPGMHTAAINSVAIDAGGRWAVTGASDKTVRVWSVADGTLLRTIRLPRGAGDIGKVYAVAESPDGAMIAAGGWTRWSAFDRQEQVYLFDRSTGGMLGRIGGLPSVVTGLAFSPDGRSLAATLASGGLRVFAVGGGPRTVASDENYGADAYAPVFAPNGALAASGLDGRIRLYQAGTFSLIAAVAAQGGRQPVSLGFSPDGTSIAVGYVDSTNVSVLDATSLRLRSSLDVGNADNGDLSRVAFSADGKDLYAAGSYAVSNTIPILAWSDAGRGTRRQIATGGDVVKSLVPLPDGDLLVATQGPFLSRIAPDGTIRWRHGPPSVDFRDQAERLLVSTDGTMVDFGHDGSRDVTARVDLSTRGLMANPPHDGRTTAPNQVRLPIAAWRNTDHPTLAGHRLALEQYEISRSVAIAPAGDRFVLGSDWALRAFDAKGSLVWMAAVPGSVWAANISGDGRLAIAAFGDGTIRWFRMTDGFELLALMPLPDNSNWVAWTPDGHYASTASAQGVVQWQTNHGWDAAATSIPISDIAGSYLPTLLPIILKDPHAADAVDVATQIQDARAAAARDRSDLRPNAMLQILAVGISNYADPGLRSKSASRDARDYANAIRLTQLPLYTNVTTTLLLDKEASAGNIRQALQAMQAKANAGTLSIVLFTGYRTMADGKYYFLPYDSKPRDATGIQATGIPIEEVHAALRELAARGRVLFLLDAADYGPTLPTGGSASLAAALSGPNITVIVSAAAGSVTQDGNSWQHGPFTGALLDALNDRTADGDHPGFINSAGLADYVAKRVRSLTDGKQSTAAEVGFDGTLFVTGL